jgi:hypothetical protein
VLQNWSCGYYLMYFTPLVPPCLLYLMWTNGSLRDRRVWMGLSAAAVVTFALTYPFLTPYLEAQRIFGFERPRGEVLFFSANVWSYLTSSEWLRLLGSSLRYYPRAESEAFQGFVPMALALVALFSVIRTRADSPAPRPPMWRLIVSRVLAAIAALQLAGLLSVILWGGVNLSLGPMSLRATTASRLLVQLVVVVAAWLATSPAGRLRAVSVLRAPATFYVAMTLLAAWLSLGPVPRTGGADVLIASTSLYDLLYAYVPGYTGVRVPARYAMIVGLFLSIVAAYGCIALRRARWGARAWLVAAVLFLIEGAAVPLAMNQTWGQHEQMPPSVVHPARAAPSVYHRLATLPEGTVVAEFPFGDPAWEIRYLYYSTVHWKPILNGYSGSVPPDYAKRVARLRRVGDSPEAAWDAVRAAGTTHVVVHLSSFANSHDATGVHVWLESHGATRIESFPEGDVLYSLPDAR